MSEARVRGINSNCYRAGNELVRKARESHERRAQDGRRECGAVAKEVASYIVAKNRDRKYFY